MVGDFRHMKQALRSGGDLNAEYNGWAPLHWALYQGQHGAAKFLVRLGANIECQGDWGRTPLMCVLEQDWVTSERFAIWLINRGANVNHADHHGDTAIQLAARHNLQSCIDCLLKNGAQDRRNIPCLEATPIEPIPYLLLGLKP